MDLSHICFQFTYTNNQDLALLKLQLKVLKISRNCIKVHEYVLSVCETCTLDSCFKCAIDFIPLNC